MILTFRRPWLRFNVDVTVIATRQLSLGDVSGLIEIRDGVSRTLESSLCGIQKRGCLHSAKSVR